MSRGPNDQALFERASAVVPNGIFGHLNHARLGPGYPQFIKAAKGAHSFDVDGHRYIDYMCGYGSSLFGYADPAVDEAAAKQQAKGDVLNGTAPVFVDWAELVVSMISHADWVMPCKNGTDATTMATTIARAGTGKRKILLATRAYHGADPWCSPSMAGVLREDRAHLIYFRFNDIESLNTAVMQAGDDLAGILTSGFQHDVYVDQALPTRAYAERCREICDEHGAALIVDDVRSGFRVSRDTSWTTLGVQPDITAWGKAIANGHPLSATLGSHRWRAAAETMFATGTYWFGAAALAASKATLERIRDTDYLEKLSDYGDRLRTGLDEQAARHGFGLRQTGPSTMPQILFEDDPRIRRGSVWSRTAVEHGAFIHPFHNMFICTAMNDQDLATTLDATEAAFRKLRDADDNLPPSYVEPVMEQLGLI